MSINNLNLGNIRVPGTFLNIDNSQAFSGLQQIQRQALVFGNMLSGGTATALTLVLVTSVAQAASLFGIGSQLYNIFQTWFANNPLTKVWAMPLADNGSGATATGTIALTGPATAAGTLTIYIAGRLVQVAVSSGDSATTIGANAATAINAIGSLPVTATASTGTITLTSRHKGAFANDINVQVNYYGAPSNEYTPAGVGVTITAMASGTGNPTLSSAIAVLSEETYDYIVMPYVDSTNLTALETELASRWSPLRQVQGIAFAGYNGTFSAVNTFGAGNNSQFISIMGSTGSPLPPYEWAAAITAQVAASAGNDPAQPFTTLPLIPPTDTSGNQAVIAPPKASRYPQAERNILLYDGISTFKVSRSGIVEIERLITTYQTNAAGALDASYLDVTTMTTLSYIRAQYRTTMKTKYSRSKVADNGTVVSSGAQVVTPADILGEIVAIYLLLEDAGLVQDTQQFVNNLVSQRNATDPTRIDTLIDPILISPLNIIGMDVAFILTF